MTPGSWTSPFKKIVFLLVNSVLCIHMVGIAALQIQRQTLETHFHFPIYVKVIIFNKDKHPKGMFFFLRKLFSVPQVLEGLGTKFKNTGPSPILYSIFLHSVKS